MAGELSSEPEILREYLTDLLAGKSDLKGAKHVSHEAANLQKQIITSLAKDGLLVLVILGNLKPKGYQSGTLYIDPANIIVRVVENVLLNRKKTGKSALYIATRVAAALQLHTPPFPWCSEIKVNDLRSLNILSSKPEEDEDDDYAAWDVLASTKLSIQPRSTTN